MVTTFVSSYTPDIIVSEAGPPLELLNLIPRTNARNPNNQLNSLLESYSGCQEGVDIHYT